MQNKANSGALQDGTLREKGDDRKKESVSTFLLSAFY